MDKDNRGGAGAGPGALRVVRAIAALPGVVLGVIPALIVALSHGPLFRAWPWPLVAALPATLGLALMAWTIALFARKGRGTLAPWDAPPRLVVAGPYRHVRNPMMVGVFLALVAEATAFGAAFLWVYLGLGTLAVLLYIPLVEEKRLLRRFGTDYEGYRKSVPRWLPRLTPRDGRDMPE